MNQPPPINRSRRRLLRRCVATLALLPTLDIGCNSLLAAEAPPVTSDDPTAKALKYVDDAGKADGAKPGSKCANCALYQGAANVPYGPCPLFAGKQVKATGWCMSWVPKS